MEILIAIALLGLVLAAGFTGWSQQLARGRDAARKSALQEMRQVLLSYEIDEGCYPPEAEVVCGSTDLAPYIPVVPCDPSNNQTYHFRYVRPSCGEYTLYTRLESGSDDLIDQLGCSNGCGPDGAYNYYVTSKETGL
jgi:type II secretory pathway pseudopilin PulG